MLISMADMKEFAAAVTQDNKQASYSEEQTAGHMDKHHYISVQR